MEQSDRHLENEKYLCDICGKEMLEISCELFCPNCGYRRDCTDP